VEPNKTGASHGTKYQPDDPLERISQEHLRQREVCATLDRLATLDKPDRELAAGVLPHFDTDLARHVHDEEDDLFPMLRRRCGPGDDINDTLDRLIRKHGISMDLAVRVRKIVQAMAEKDVLPNRSEAAALVGFAAHERRQLIVENAIVLPLARARLTHSDLAALRERMARRRDNADTSGQGDGG
jgi:hemerythrin-like domain-containing protein